MKSKFKVDVMGNSDIVTAIVEAIGSHNSGKAILSLLDICGYIRFQKTRYPLVYKNTNIEWTGQESIILKSGNEIVLAIEEIELHELAGIGALVD